MTESRDGTGEPKSPADDPDQPGQKNSVAGQSAGADAAGEGDSEGGNLEDKM